MCQAHARQRTQTRQPTRARTPGAPYPLPGRVAAIASEALPTMLRLRSPLLRCKQQCGPPICAAVCGQQAAGLAKQAKGKGKGKVAKARAATAEEPPPDYVKVDMDDVKRRMQGAVDAMHREFSALNVGRAAPTMLDALTVQSAAGPIPLPSVAKVLLQGPQALQARPA